MISKPYRILENAFVEALHFSRKRNVSRRFAALIHVIQLMNGAKAIRGYFRRAENRKIPPCRKMGDTGGIIRYK